MFRKTLFSIFILLLAVPLVAQLVTPASTPNSKVITPNAVAYGRTFAEWQAAWWQWAFSIPVASHPLFENGGCQTGQSGDVWFLGGRFCQSGQTCPQAATRSCTLPRGKAIFFPVSNVEDSIPEEPAFGCGDSIPPLVAGTIDEMRACVEIFTKPISGTYAYLDGAPVTTPQKYFFGQSTEFSITLPADNLLNAIGEGPIPAGTYSPVVDQGYYVMLKPLPSGKHTLIIKSMYNGAPANDITYTITVP